MKSKVRQKSFGAATGKQFSLTESLPIIIELSEEMVEEN